MRPRTVSSQACSLLTTQVIVEGLGPEAPTAAASRLRCSWTHLLRALRTSRRRHFKLRARPSLNSSTPPRLVWAIRWAMLCKPLTIVATGDGCDPARR